MISPPLFVRTRTMVSFAIIAWRPQFASAGYEAAPGRHAPLLLRQLLPALLVSRAMATMPQLCLSAARSCR